MFSCPSAAPPGRASFRQHRCRKREKNRRPLFFSGLLLAIFFFFFSGRLVAVLLESEVDAELFFPRRIFLCQRALTPRALPVQLARPRWGPVHPATINYSLSAQPDTEICPYHEPTSLKILFTQPGHAAIHLTEGARTDPIVSAELRFDSVRPRADVFIC